MLMDRVCEKEPSRLPPHRASTERAWNLTEAYGSCDEQEQRGLVGCN